MHNEIIIYKNGELELPVEVTPDKETVWLNRNQLAALFERDIKTIGKHINNALKEELDSSTVAKFATVQKEGAREVTRSVEYYNLDMIISVGYRVKSARGVEFRRWANKILKDYIVQGYAVNERRLAALNRVVKIQSKTDRLSASVPASSQESIVPVLPVPRRTIGFFDSRPRFFPCRF